MTQFEIYSTILSVAVLLLTAAVSTYMLVEITRLTTQLIRLGGQDEQIKKERLAPRKSGCFGRVIDTVVSVLCTVVLLAVFVLSLVIGDRQGTYINGYPTLYVVESSSMSKKHEKNTYLTENGLDDQFQTFDLIVTYRLPDEFELELYDIVLYEVDDILIAHRIVEIIEPNENHPEHRYFRMQGDAIEIPDRFPVYYSQMRGIYSGTRIPFLGSFVKFMQSPAGWLCILAVLIAMIGTPILQKKIKVETDKRLGILFSSGRAVPAETLGKIRSFKRTLTHAGTETVVYRERLADYLIALPGVDVTKNKTAETYTKGKRTIAKLVMHGETLCVYLPLDPLAYDRPGYVFAVNTDPKYASYPVCLPLTSHRDVALATELVGDVIFRNNPFGG